MDEVFKVDYWLLLEENDSEHTNEDLFGDGRFKVDVFQVRSQYTSVLNDLVEDVEVETVVNRRSVAQVEAYLLAFQTQGVLDHFLGCFVFVFVEQLFYDPITTGGFLIRIQLRGDFLASNEVLRQGPSIEDSERL